MCTKDSNENCHKTTCKDNNNVSKGTTFLQIRSALMESFTKFDSSQTGYLTYEMFINFVNQTRKSLYLGIADAKITNNMIKILDPVNNKKVTKERLFASMDMIIDLLGQPGKYTKKLITKTFKDFDITKKGHLNRPDMRLLLDMICDIIHVQRLEEWELDRLLNLLDDDGNKEINLQEFISNYLFIADHLMANKKFNMKSENLLEEMAKCTQEKSEPSFINNLLENFNQLRMKRIQREKLANHDSEKLNSEKLNVDDIDVNNTRKSASDMIPLTSLIDKRTFGKNNKDENLCDKCKTYTKTTSFRLDGVQQLASKIKRNSMKEGLCGSISSKLKDKFGGVMRLEKKIDEILVEPYKNVELC